ncbi:MAG: OmpA family protein [Candidatus Cloacimonetes bacterium]|nr:OmpA family protein [Candidatus Cloacimonadota bacterium]
MSSLKRSRAQENYWVSFSDLMSGLLFVFILLFVLTLIVNKVSLRQKEEIAIKTSEQLKEEKEKYHKKTMELLQIRLELSDKEKALLVITELQEKKSTELGQTKESLEKRELEAANLRKNIEDQLLELNRLKELQILKDDQLKSLEISQNKKQKELDSLRKSLKSQADNLSKTSELLKSKEIELLQSSVHLKDKESALNSLQTNLSKKETQVFSLKEIVEKNKKELNDVKQKVEEILGVKKKIISYMQQEFSKQGVKVQIDPLTGDIQFPAKILFAYNESTLKQEGKNALLKFFPVYSKLLIEHGYISAHIAEIIIEGHSDPEGGYLYNLNLSQKRALSVVEFLNSDHYKESPEDIRLQKILTANGRSFVEPVLDKKTKKVNFEKSRRVVFKFRLKNELRLKDIKSSLEEMTK